MAAFGWAAGSARTLIALDRGDLSKLPFSDDGEFGESLADASQLERTCEEVAPFLTLAGPCVVVRRGWPTLLADGCLHDVRQLPVRAPYTLGMNASLHPQQREDPDRCVHGETTFYVFDAHDRLSPPIGRCFPACSRRAAMPAAVRKHVRYPESLLNVPGRRLCLYP